MNSEPHFKNTEQLEELLKEIPKLALNIVKADEGKMYRHTLLNLGILNRTYELTETGIWAIQKKRPHTGASMLRSLIETLGLAHYAWKQTKNDNKNEVFEKLHKMLFGSREKGAEIEAVNILTCIDGATTMFPHLRESYDQCSELVHPNSGSLFHFMKANPEKGEGAVEVIIPFYDFKEEDGVKLLNQIGECCHHTIRLCKELSEKLRSL